MKPTPEQRISTSRTAALAVLHGLPAVLLALILASLAGESVSPVELVLFIASLVVVLFALLSVGLALSWNRRAARLQRLRERRFR